jgi:hypothetical protein
MALKVWFEEDVTNALSAAALAADLLPSTDSPEDEAYVRGFHAAIRVVCTSFGMRLPASPTPRRESALQIENPVRCLVVGATD